MQSPLYIILDGPLHAKLYFMTCLVSEVSDHPMNPCGLISLCCQSEEAFALWLFMECKARTDQIVQMCRLI